MKRILLAPGLLAVVLATSPAEEIPISGEPVPGLASVDQAYSKFMERHQIPGGSVAIMKNGRLVYARGFGWSDRESNRPVEADTLFRIASLSKPITSMVVAHLVEEGKLAYDDRALPLLGYATPTYEGATRDPRLDTITIRHLLQHSGGWDRDTAKDPDGNTGFDPMFYTSAAARDLTGRAQPPATAGQVARWMVGKPLQFDPGTRYAYSNLGYCLLGRVIEKVTGQTYDDYTRSLLARAGISAMRIGGSRLEELAPRETRYFDFPGASLRTSAWGEEGTPNPYCHSVPTMDAHGGWIASPTDLVRFTTLFDGRPQPADLLPPRQVAQIHARPSFARPVEEARNFYGLGWKFFEREDASFRNWFHSGSLPGTMAMLIRSDNGLTWAALFNLRPRNSGAAFQDLDRTMWEAVNGVTSWPTL